MVMEYTAGAVQQSWHMCYLLYITQKNREYYCCCIHICQRQVHPIACVCLLVSWTETERHQARTQQGGGGQKYWAWERGRHYTPTNQPGRCVQEGWRLSFCWTIELWTAGVALFGSEQLPSQSASHPPLITERHIIPAWYFGIQILRNIYCWRILLLSVLYCCCTWFTSDYVKHERWSCWAWYISAGSYHICNERRNTAV